MNEVMPASKRWPITISIMLASIMVALDLTIANVALPHIQGSVSASLDQISWVLTSYILASALMMPMTGWLAARLGRKRLFLYSIVGFTIASMLCGMATSLFEIVLYRLLQGAFGATLMPLTQAVLLDINPPEKHGQAMAIWGMSAVLGPVLGPVLGGWLTEHLSWRWVFFINLPVGILAALGVTIFVSRAGADQRRPLDFVGYGSLVLFMAGFQLMLDRGPGEDWFNATEIWVELALAGVGLWVFVVHTLTAEKPFFPRAMVTDRNFVVAAIFGFVVSILMYGTLALLPTLMQQLMGYSVVTAGVATMSRGAGSFVGMVTVAALSNRADPRLLIVVGLVLTMIAQMQMSHFDLSMDMSHFVVSGFLHGVGVALSFMPAAALAFTTLAPSLRADGAALLSLIRNLGGSMGVSIMQALLVTNSAVMHASLAGRVTPSDPAVQADLATRPGPDGLAGLAMLNAEVDKQAAMVAYLNDFKLMVWLTILSLPLVLLLRRRRPAGGEAAHADE